MIKTFQNWDSFSLFFSAEYTQSYLKRCYEKLHIENAEKKSYENCYPFIYYLEHGQVYYNQAIISPMIIQPILIFYGLVHLIKASILTTDPNYPETTSVLAHGVSTRKRKKQDYDFFEDEVKFQKNGLFPLLAEKMFHMKHLEGEKVIMGDLLKNIPELNDLFQQLTGEKTFMELKEEYGILSLPIEILDHYHMTENRFIEYYQSRSKADVSINKKGRSLNIEFTNLPISDPTPLKYNTLRSSFSLPLIKGAFVSYSELLHHFLLLYNLSMIARYETEWWSELIKTMPNKDFPFIKTFLNITLTKSPYLVYQYLTNKN